MQNMAKQKLRTPPQPHPPTHTYPFTKQNDLCPHTHSSWRKSPTVRSREIMSLATILKPNSLMLAWTASLYSGPRTNGLLPSPGPPWTPWGSGSFGSKLPRVPLFNTGSLYTLVWGLKVIYCFWMTFCSFWTLNAWFGLSTFFWRIDSRSTSTPSTWGQGTTGLNWSATSLLGRLGCGSLSASLPCWWNETNVWEIFGMFVS